MAFLAVIERWSTAQIGWNANCAMFAGDIWQAWTGQDPIADIRERMTGARGFAEVLREGDGTLASVVTRRIGRPVSPRLSRRGDIVGLNRNGLHLGACMGSTAVFVGDGHFDVYPMRDICMTWMVPRG